jgi:coenzyme F420-reducing hydrogenase delta subunit
MQARTDGRPFDEEAVVQADLCVSCGICVGACPSSTPFRRTSGLVTGIDLPDFNLAQLYSETLAAAGVETGKKQVLVFACKQARGLDNVADERTGVVRLPCIGMLPPSFVDFVIGRGHAEAVYLEGCSGGDCRNRFGAEWTAARVAGTRDPYLRRRVPRERLRLGWASDSSGRLARRLEDFAAEIAELEKRPDSGEDQS